MATANYHLLLIRNDDPLLDVGDVGSSPYVHAFWDLDLEDDQEEVFRRFEYLIYEFSKYQNLGGAFSLNARSEEKGE